MKKLFLFLLKKYSSNESGRLFIQSVLHEQVCNTYSEQTIFGNVYNSYIEFLMGNPTIVKAVKENNATYIKGFENGLKSTFEVGIDHIKNTK